MSTRKLYKIKKGAKISGVCTGIGVYSGIDVTIIRLIFVILALCGGPGILLYIICLVVMPDEPDYIDYTEHEKEDNQN